MQQVASLTVSVSVATKTPLARTGDYAAWLNAGDAQPQPLGPLLQLAVEKGDTVTVTTHGLYQQAQRQSFWSLLLTFLGGAAAPAPAGGDPGRHSSDLPLLQLGVAAGLLALQQLGEGVPRGYLRVLSFYRDSAMADQQTQQLSELAHHNYEPAHASAAAGRVRDGLHGHQERVGY